MKNAAHGIKRTVGWLWNLTNDGLGFAAGRGGHYYNDPVNGTVISVGGWLSKILYQYTRTPALALGDYILTPDCSFLEAPTYAHELGHVDQYRILGPFFLPLYVIGAALGALRGDNHDANPFEVDADGRAGMPNRYHDTRRWGWPSVVQSLPYHPNDISLRW